MLTSLTQGLHTDEHWIGLTISVGTLAVAIAGPFVGIFSDMVGRKRVIVPAGLLLMIPTALLAFSSDLPTFLALRFLQGLCIPAVFGVVVAYVSEEWLPAQIPGVMSWYLTGTIMGGFAGRFIAAEVTDRWHWSATYLVLSAVTGGLGLLVWGLLPPSRHFKPSGNVFQTFRLMAGHTRNGRLIGTCAVGGIMLFSLVACFTYIDFFLAAPPYSLSGTTLGSIFAVYLVAVVVTPLNAAMIRRFGRPRTLAAALGLAMIGLGLTLSGKLVLIVFGLALFSAFVFVVHGVAMGTVGLVTHAARSAAVGVYVMFYYVGGSLGAILPSVAWTRAGWGGCVALMIVALLLAVLIGWWAWRKPLGEKQAISPPLLP